MRSLRQARTGVATVALAVLLVACGGGSGSPSDDRQNTDDAPAGSAPSKASPKSTVPASPPDTSGTSLADGEVCAQLPASEVEKIVGKPIEATDLMTDLKLAGRSQQT